MRLDRFKLLKNKTYLLSVSIVSDSSCCIFAPFSSLRGAEHSAWELSHSLGYTELIQLFRAAGEVRNIFIFFLKFSVLLGWPDLFQYKCHPDVVSKLFNPK